MLNPTAPTGRTQKSLSPRQAPNKNSNLELPNQANGVSEAGAEDVRSQENGSELKSKRRLPWRDNT